MSKKTNNQTSKSQLADYHFTDHRLPHRVFSSVYGSDHCVQTAV